MQDSRTTTYPAYKTLGMPLLSHGRYVVRQDGFQTAAAFRCKQVVIIRSAVGLPFILVKTVLTEEVIAHGAEKVLRMPGLVQGSDALLHIRKHCA